MHYKRLASILAMASAICSTSVLAATFTVNDTVDAPDANPNDNVCATAAGTCTLRAAVMQANASPGADTIQLPAAPTSAPLAVNIPRPTDQTANEGAESGDIDITSDITMYGNDRNDPTKTVIANTFGKGLNGFRIFRITMGFGPSANAGGPTVVMEGVTLMSGAQYPKVAGFGQDDEKGGGAILVVNPQAQSGFIQGVPPSLTLRKVNLENNVSYVTGGAVSVYGGNLVLEDCLVKDNNAGDYFPGNTQGGQSGPTNGGTAFQGGGQGGGVAVWSGSLVATRTIFTGNAAQNGGALYVQDAGKPALAELVDSVVNNSNAFMGGAIFNMGRGEWDYGAATLVTHGLILNRTTVENNTAEFAGGGIWNLGSALISNSTFSLNKAEDPPGPPFFLNKGGGIYNSGRVLDVVSSTIAGNDAYAARVEADATDVTAGGDEVYLDYTNAASSPDNLRSYRFTFQNSIIGDGPPTDPTNPGVGVDDNCNGPTGYTNYITSLGNNIDSGTTCFKPVVVASLQSSDLVNTNPALGPLADNGGLATLPTQSHVLTRAITASSPAVAAGNLAACPGSDQRGFSRTVAGSTATCDVGAFQVAVDTTQSGNRAPVATPDKVSTNQDTAVTFNVLANDRDPDVADVLTLVTTSISSPVLAGTNQTGGTVQAQPNGTIAFSPAAGITGEVAFSYGVTDGNATTTGNVSVFVYPAAANQPPVGGPDVVSVLAGKTVDINVLANDTDPDAGDVLTIAGFTPPTAGTVTGNVGGQNNNTNVRPTSLIYQAPNAAGVYEFTYTVQDNRGGTTAGVKVTVTVRDPVTVTASATSLQAPQGGGTTGQLTASVTSPTVTITVKPTLGTLFLGSKPDGTPLSAGQFYYQPLATAQAGASDTFEVAASDGFSSARQAFTVTILAGSTTGPGTTDPGTTDPGTTDPGNNNSPGSSGGGSSSGGYTGGGGGGSWHPVLLALLIVLPLVRTRRRPAVRC